MSPVFLTILTESEVSLEYKLAEYDNLFPTATSIGAGPTFDIEETGSGISFLSLVFPAKTPLSVYTGTSSSTNRARINLYPHRTAYSMKMTSKQ